MGPGWERKLLASPVWKPNEEPPKPTLDSMAYVVYSSGTTGKPKGKLNRQVEE